MIPGIFLSYHVHPLVTLYLYNAERNSFTFKFICGTFNDALSHTGYIASNGKVNCPILNGKELGKSYDWAHPDRAYLHPAYS